MSYVDNNLMNGEEVLYRANYHWITFFWSGFWIFIGITSMIGKAGIAGFGIVGFGLFLALMNFLNNKSSEFAITNKRVIVKAGLIRRQSLETLLTKIEGISVKQGIFGRILGFGTIVINGTGGSKEGFTKIVNPLQFRKKLQEIIDQKQ